MVYSLVRFWTLNERIIQGSGRVWVVGVWVVGGFGCWSMARQGLGLGLGGGDWDEERVRQVRWKII